MNEKTESNDDNEFEKLKKKRSNSDTELKTVIESCFRF